MKKDNIIALSIFLLLFNVTNNTIHAQVDNYSWCPNGASWLYLRATQFSREYLKLNYVRDTILDNKPTKILAAYQVEIVGPGPFPNYNRLETYLRDEYYCNVNDSIFWWNNDEFTFLYAFNSNIGDQWPVDSSKYYSCDNNVNFSSDTFTVTHSGTQIFDGVSFGILEGNTKGRWSIGSKIVKNIGSLSTPYPTPLDPDPTSSPHPCRAQYPYEAPHTLVCYYDSLRGSLAFGSTLTGSCSYELTVIRHLANESTLGIPIKVYPNPTTSSMFVSISDASITIQSFDIYDINGRLLKTGRFLSLGQQIDVHDISAGVYVLWLHDKDTSYPLKFIKYDK